MQNDTFSIFGFSQKFFVPLFRFIIILCERNLTFQIGIPLFSSHRRAFSNQAHISNSSTYTVAHAACICSALPWRDFFCMCKWLLFVFAPFSAINSSAGTRDFSPFLLQQAPAAFIWLMTHNLLTTGGDVPAPTRTRHVLSWPRRAGRSEVKMHGTRLRGERSGGKSHSAKQQLVLAPKNRKKETALLFLCTGLCLKGWHAHGFESHTRVNLENWSIPSEKGEQRESVAQVSREWERSEKGEK